MCLDIYHIQGATITEHRLTTHPWRITLGLPHLPAQLSGKPVLGQPGEDTLERISWKASFKYHCPNILTLRQEF